MEVVCYWHPILQVKKCVLQNITRPRMLSLGLDGVEKHWAEPDSLLHRPLQAMSWPLQYRPLLGLDPPVLSRLQQFFNNTWTWGLAATLRSSGEYC